jgi:hypothetical protein
MLTLISLKMAASGLVLLMAVPFIAVKAVRIVRNPWL